MSYPTSPLKAYYFKMAARMQNSDLEEDIELHNHIKEKVNYNLQQSEIIDFISLWNTNILCILWVWELYPTIFINLEWAILTMLSI